MGVTLSEVTRAAKAHRAPLAGESAGYLVLAIADQVLSAPRLVQAADIQLTEDGGLRVLSGRASSEAEAELGLRQALDALLLVASSGSAALTRASRRTSPVGLPALVRELEAALIPVNRAAARRALSRLHRETARAVNSGDLPKDVLQAAPTQQLAVAPDPAVAAQRAPTTPPIVEVEPEAEPRGLLGAALAPGLPAVSPEMEAMLTALCMEAAEVRAPEEPELGNGMTMPLDFPPASEVAPELEMTFDVDVEFELIESESEAAPTVLRDAPVALLSEPLADEPLSEMPVEACTRPEPVVLRRWLRPEPVLALPKSEQLRELISRTPTLGSLAALPVLPAQLIAELDAIAADAEEVLCHELVLECVAAEGSVTELMICSTPIEECTEPMPKVAPLAASRGVAIVTSRKSELSELLSSFQVADDDSNQGLCRAIKEMAGLDLTPAPLAALMR